MQCGDLVEIEAIDVVLPASGRRCPALERGSALGRQRPSRLAPTCRVQSAVTTANTSHTHSAAPQLFLVIQLRPMNIFNVAFAVGFYAPALVVGTLAFLWRPALRHFWWFVGLGGVSPYVLMAIFVTYALSNIGLSGYPPLAAAGPVDAVMRHYLLSMLAWSISSVLVLFVIRYFFSKA
jgi:hypothetical protein